MSNQFSGTKEVAENLAFNLVALNKYIQRIGIDIPLISECKQFKGGLTEAFKNQKTKFLVISFSSDWLYTTKENKDIVIALNASGADVSYSEII